MRKRDRAATTDHAVVNLTLRVEKLDQLAKLRRLLTHVAGFVNLPRDKADDLVLATHEVAANAIVHGRPPAVVGVQADQGGLTCEVTDSGHGFQAVIDPVSPATPTLAENGRGLRLARELQDEVSTYRNPAGGFTVTMRSGER